MALQITEDCSECGACVDTCPNQGIRAETPYYVIDPLRCTECVGAEDEPQCRLICPVDCIVDHPEYRETREQLLEKYRVAILGSGTSK